MNKNQRMYRIGMWAIALVLIMSFLAITLPQKALAASEGTFPSTYTFNPYVRNGKLYIETNGFPGQSKYKVRVKDAAQSMPKFFNLGWLVTKKKTDQLSSFTVPKGLKSPLWLDVCLKSQTNDKLYCKKVYNSP